MRDLLDAPESEVARERRRVAVEGFGAQLLALQDERGYWNNDEYGEDQSRKSVFWSLALLRRLGADPADPSVRTAVDRVHESVVWKYWDDLPYFHGEVEPCINGGVLSQGCLLREARGGQRTDHRPAAGRTAARRRLELRGPRDPPRSPPSTPRSCVLEGLLEHERAVGEVPAALAEARNRGEEYLLKRSGSTAAFAPGKWPRGAT